MFYMKNPRTLLGPADFYFLIGYVLFIEELALWS